MVVGLNSASAGLKNGTVAINYASDGTGTSGLGTTPLTGATINVTGAVYNAAVAALIAPASPIVLANQRVGGSLSQALTVANTSPAGTLAESLSASFGVLSGNAVTNGASVNLLGAGASSSAMAVGLDTSSAGARSGTAAVNFLSDGAGTSGLAAVSAGAQIVSLQGDVYRLASPQINTASVTLFARVGDAAPSASINIANTSPDVFTERLNAAFVSAPAGFGTSGTITGLAAGALSNTLGVALNTSAGGQFAGQANIGFVSSGTGTTGAPDASVGSGQVSLTGRVYTPAVTQLNNPTVDFGIVHKGDSVALHNVGVGNAAPISAPNDQLRGGLSGAAGPFTAAGTLAGVAAQASDSSSLTVALDTSAAGNFQGQATLATSSHNAEMADLVLAPKTVALQAQVNNFAQASVLKAGGAGSFSQAGTAYTLNFGTLALGGADGQASLEVFNSAQGFADLLRGSFDTAGVASPFGAFGFSSFDNVVAGGHVTGLGVTFSPTALGAFESSIVLHASGFNASGYSGALADQTITLRGAVAAVPEPRGYALMLAGLLLVGGIVKRRSGGRASA